MLQVCGLKPKKLSARWCPTTYSWCPFYIFSPLPFLYIFTPAPRTSWVRHCIGFFLLFFCHLFCHDSVSCCVFYLFWYRALVCHFLLFTFFCVFPFVTSPVLFPPHSAHLFLIPSIVCLCISSLFSLMCLSARSVGLSPSLRDVSPIGMFGFWFLDFCIWFELRVSVAL